MATSAVGWFHITSSSSPRPSTPHCSPLRCGGEGVDRAAGHPRGLAPATQPSPDLRVAGDHGDHADDRGHDERSANGVEQGPLTVSMTAWVAGLDWEGLSEER